jgi:methionyl aminopeptidase
MFVAGEPDEAAKKLLQATYDCWVSAMEFCKPGNDYKDIGGIIEDIVVERGFTTVRNFCGHGIGSVFHTNPNILHYRNSEPNGQMTAGHTFTIEPMICEGSGKLRFKREKVIIEFIANFFALFLSQSTDMAR